LCIFLTTKIYSQTLKIKDTSSMISIISKNRDTLYLSDTQIGHTIYKLWEEVLDEEKPIIIFKNHSWIIEEKLKQNK